MGQHQPLVPKTILVSMSQRSVLRGVVRNDGSRDLLTTHLSTTFIF